LTKKQQLVKLNLGIKANPQYVKVNAQLAKEKIEELFKEFKDVFAWTYKNLKGIPLELAQPRIKLNTSIPPTHQTKYRLNLNYIVVVKQDIDKLLVIEFIQPIEEATWLSPIVVVPKKNGKLKICVDFRKLNKATKKDLYPLPFFDEVFNHIVGFIFRWIQDTITFL
jgi:hypothetical protein